MGVEGVREAVLLRDADWVCFLRGSLRHAGLSRGWHQSVRWISGAAREEGLDEEGVGDEGGACVDFS